MLKKYHEHEFDLMNSQIQIVESKKKNQSTGILHMFWRLILIGETVYK